MKNVLKLSGMFVLAAFLLASCAKDTDLAPVSEVALARDLPQYVGPGAPDHIAFSSAAAAQANPNGQRDLAIWADCEGFATIGTRTNFKPAAGNFDELYIGASFKDGVGAISESKPGDRDYNGGRWHVNSLKVGLDPAKYADACAVEDLDLNDFEATPTYFECPLRPLR